MKEKKFRAWDKSQKKMYTINEFRFVDNRLKYVALHVTDDESILIHMYGESIILMQYTGLKDSKGKEGYHHDLFLSQDRNIGKLIEIIWEDGGWMGKYIGSSFKFPLNQGEMDRSEIIGNIYEDKELLNERHH